METTSPRLRSMQRAALEDPDAFWAGEVAHLPWFTPWESVFEWTPPTFRWFSGATTNLAYACLDRHIATGAAGRAALIALREDGRRDVLTYAQLLREVQRLAAALRAAGIGKGDRVTISMPTIAEAIALMLACVRVGAIHSVVFAGFGASALADRIRLSGSKAVFVADATLRKGRVVPLVTILDDALAAGLPDVERVVVLDRFGVAGTSDPRKQSWQDFVAGGAGGDVSVEPMEANEPAFILATSGTTATPKLAVHVHGGYMAGVDAMSRWVYGLRPQDVWWATSDIGWIVGHSYIVYGPLIAGATTIAYEGALDHPAPDTFFKVVEEQMVSAIFTAPTAARLLMRFGEEGAKACDLSSVERVFCAGETLNPPAWQWLQKRVFDDRVPVIDHMWQTETAAPMFANPYGLGLLPIKAGSAGVPMPGWQADVATLEGHAVPDGEQGIVVIRRPFPSLTPTIWNDPERYARDYWGRIPGVYFTGDAARRDEDGYYWFAGRADEIIKIAAHRIGTVEVETAFMHHPAVAEAGVTGKPDEMRGEVISAFVVLRPGHEPSAELEQELRATVRDVLGPVAVIADVNVVSLLPKTRSGKIMRRVLKAVVSGQDVGDVSTIEDEGSVEEARDAWARLTAEVAGEA